MISIPDTEIQSFEHPQWSLFRDSEGKIVPVKSLQACCGQGSYLLTHNQLKGVYAQVHFINSLGDSTSSYWQQLTEESCGLYPKIHDMGVFGDFHFSIFEIPNGEPVQSYLNRLGPISAKAAVKLVLEFVQSLQQEPLQLHQSIAFSPKCIWINQSKPSPHLCFGEIQTVEGVEPLNHNIRLLVDLLGFLTDCSEDSEFHNLCSRIIQCTSMEEVENKINDCLPNASTCHRTNYHHPASLIEQVTDRYNKTEFVSKEDSFDLGEFLTKRVAWPAIVTTVACIFFLVVFNTFSFNTNIFKSQFDSIKVKLENEFDEEFGVVEDGSDRATEEFDPYKSYSDFKSPLHHRFNDSDKETEE